MQGDAMDAVADFGVGIGKFVEGFEAAPPSSVRNAPAAEMAMKMRCGFCGSRMMVCRHMPPAPGCQSAPFVARRAGNSVHDLPPSVVLKSPASSTPAKAVSGSVSDGSMCHTRLNSHGCCVPSYHLCVPTSPA
jgi:hypothetical protein